jgi:hypothetical protein
MTQNFNRAHREAQIEREREREREPRNARKQDAFCAKIFINSVGFSTFIS